MNELSTSSRIRDNFRSDRIHVGDTILVNDGDTEVGQVDDQSLVDLLDTLNHESISLILGHVWFKVPEISIYNFLTSSHDFTHIQELYIGILN